MEPCIGFSNLIKKSTNITVVNDTVQNFNSNNKFDIISIFGVMHYFSGSEAIEIYKKYYNYLKDSGKMIIKNQFGLESDVTVNGWSEEQQRNYYAEYRHIDKEVDMLISTGFSKVKYYDIYPSECNRWDNTHFYAIVADF